MQPNESCNDDIQENWHINFSWKGRIQKQISLYKLFPKKKKKQNTITSLYNKNGMINWIRIHTEKIICALQAELDSIPILASENEERAVIIFHGLRRLICYYQYFNIIKRLILFIRSAPTKNTYATSTVHPPRMGSYIYIPTWPIYTDLVVTAVHRTVSDINVIRVANVAREIVRFPADPGRYLDSEDEREGHADEQDLYIWSKHIDNI